MRPSTALLEPKEALDNTAGWLELSDVYATQQRWSSAAYCVEEALLAEPRSWLLHCRYADLRYSMGGTDNLTLARQYYARALELNSSESNTRALYGLALTTAALSSTGKGSSAKGGENRKLFLLAFDRLSNP